MNLCGLSLGPEGERLVTGEDNLRGFWECLSLKELNDEVLSSFNGDWASPPYLLPGWWKNPKLADIAVRARQQLQESLPGPQVGWKDPRNALTLPFWCELFASRPVIILLLRNPLEISKSLELRNQLDRHTALALWSVYMQAALHHIVSLPVVVVRFQDLLNEPKPVLSRICNFLTDQGFQNLAPPREEDFRNFLSEDLVHWERDAKDLAQDPDVLPPQLQFFDLLERLPESSTSFELPEGMPGEDFRMGCHLTLFRNRPAGLNARSDRLHPEGLSRDPANPPESLQAAETEIPATADTTERNDVALKLQKKLRESSLQLERLRQRAQSQDQRIAQLVAARDLTRGQLEDLQEKLSARLDKQQSRTAALLAACAQMGASRETWEAGSAQLKEFLEDARQREVILREELEQLRSEKQASLVQLEQVRTHWLLLREEDDRRREQLDLLTRRSRELEARIDGLSGENELLRREGASRAEALAHREEQVSRLETSLQQLTGSLKEWEGKLDLERTRAGNLERARDEALQNLSKLEEVSSRQAEELLQLRERVQELEPKSDLPGGEAGSGWARNTLNWGARSVWSTLHSAYLSLPVKGAGREKLKAIFYAVHGRVFPTSPHYEVYLNARRQRRKRVPFSPESPGDFLTPPSGSTDILLFPVIDWDFRHQRPQQLAIALARQGYRVFYFSTRFGEDVSGYEPVPDFVAPGVCVVRLPCALPHPLIYRDQLSPQQLGQIVDGIEKVRNRFSIGATISLLNHPFWLPAASRLSNSRLVYDCMDHHGGFSNTSEEMLNLEKELMESAALVLFSSQRLSEKFGGGVRSSLLVRNAAEFDHFSTRAKPPALKLKDGRPVIGYYGAIADWFDSALVAYAARKMPECRFVLIGSTYLADLAPLAGLDNVELPGEIPYSELPAYLHAFDVCMIPFLINELTLCTNPVKVYEYLAAGKPVVSVALPELEELSEVVRIARTPREFVEHLTQALPEAPREIVEQRRSFARAHTWQVRAEQLKKQFDTLFPKVSVVVLTHNNLQFTEACLTSLERWTDYPDWELIVVDNASSDGTVDFLKDFAADRDFVTLALNPDNRGFAAGNNQGARHATGDYLLFLNNDTYVTPGWMGTMVGHFQRHPDLGALNPVTNNIGNEARIDIHYGNMEEMIREARRYTRSHPSELLDLRSTAFFCVMIPSRIWREVGELDEDFGMGFFEDDDYSQRLNAAGYRLACAEDVFVHHHLSASFSQLPSEERQKLFEENKRHFESKWSTWVPHKYRT